MALCALYLFLRPLSPGMAIAEPEGAFLAGVSFLAVFLCALGLLARREWLRPDLGFWGPLGVLTLCAAGAVQAASGGNYQLACDLGNAWLGDLFTVLAISATLRVPGARRLYLSCFAGGIAAAAAYGVYQRYFGLDYLRRIFSAENGFQFNEHFNIRLQSDRVSGPFSYANALAAVCLLALPLLAGLARLRPAPAQQGDRLGQVVRQAVRGALLLVLLALAYSGSKAGIAVALLAQYAGLVLQMPRRTVLGALAAGGWLAALIGTAGGVSYALFWLIGSGAGATAALTLFAGCWFLLLLWLPKWLERLPRWPGLLIVAAGTAAALAGGTWFLSASEDSATGAARAAMVRQMDVRLNYWRAGLSMAADHPGRGVGLDNFGENYPAYKLPQGWEVQRAHNQYIQLAADGGLPLLGAFLLFWVFYFAQARRPGTPERTDAPSAPTPAKVVPLAGASAPAAQAEGGTLLRLMPILGTLTAAVAFFLTYAFSLRGTFTGLGLEFLMSELAGAPGSIRQQSGSLWGVLVHGGAHLLIFPAVSILVFHGVWRLLENGVPPQTRLWLRLGVAAVLAHVFFDFVLYHTAVAGLFWAACALGRSGAEAEGAQAATPMRLGLLPARGMMLLMLAAGLSLFMLNQLPHLKGSTALSGAQKLTQALTDPDVLQEALQEVDEALIFRPRDAESHRLRAQLLEILLQMRLILDPRRQEQLRQEALREMAQATECAPHNASLRRARAQQVLTLGQNLPASRAQATQLMREAVERYPTKAEYRLALAFALQNAGDTAGARTQAQEALKYHDLATDNPLRLSPDQLLRARRLAGGGL